MMATTHDAFPSDRELVLTRTTNAPREKVFRAWTDPELLKQWFAPLPWTVSAAETDVRPSKSSLHCHERLVSTDAYTSAWAPSEKPFMTVILTFEDEGGRTKYTARVRHWTVADREAHEKMGFHEGWGQCTDQLAELVAKL